MIKKKIKIQYDDLVKDLLKGESQPPNDIYYLSGFVGPHEDNDTITLYLDPLLYRSIAIKIEDILHTTKITRTHSPIRGTIVWFQNATQYLYYGKAIEMKSNKNKKDHKN